MQIYVTSVCEKGILKQTLHFLNVCDFPSFSASRGYSREFNKQIRSFGTIKSIHLCLISIKTYSSSSILGKKANKQPYFLNFFLGEGMPLPPKKFEKKKVLWDNYRNATDHIWGAMSPPFYMARTSPLSPPPPLCLWFPLFLYGHCVPLWPGTPLRGEGAGREHAPPPALSRGQGRIKGTEGLRLIMEEGPNFREIRLFHPPPCPHLINKQK